MKTDPVEQIIATRADFWIVEMAQPENHSSNDELQRYAINRDFVEDFPYARFGNVRFRETSKYSHRYGQTCSTYVIGTAHACGLVEGTLARDRGELVARSKNTRGGRYIVYIYIYIEGNSNKNVLQNQQHLLSLAAFVRLANWPAGWVSKTAFPPDFHSPEEGEGIEYQSKNESKRIELPRSLDELSSLVS